MYWSRMFFIQTPRYWKLPKHEGLVCKSDELQTRTYVKLEDSSNTLVTMWLLIFCFLKAYLQGWRGTQSRHFATTHYVCVPPLPLPQAAVVLIQSSHAPPKLFVIGLEHPPPSLDFLCATRTGMWCCRPPYQHTHALVPVMSIQKKVQPPIYFYFSEKEGAHCPISTAFV